MQMYRINYCAVSEAAGGTDRHAHGRGGRTVDLEELGIARVQRGNLPRDSFARFEQVRPSISCDTYFLCCNNTYETVKRVLDFHADSSFPRGDA